MNINLHIENLVLDGLAVDHTHLPELQVSLQNELGRLLTNNDLAADFQVQGKWDRLQGGSIRLAPGNTPSHMGRQIAGAIYHGIGTVSGEQP